MADKRKVDVDDDDNRTELKEMSSKDVILAEPVLRMMQWRCCSLLSL
jgi:hypothetical protein